MSAWPRVLSEQVPPPRWARWWLLMLAVALVLAPLWLESSPALDVAAKMLVFVLGLLFIVAVYRFPQGVMGRSKSVS